MIRYAQVVGLFIPTGLEAGFALPMFRLDGDLVLQVLDSHGRVESFLPVDAGDVAWLRARTRAWTSEGSPALYGFQFPGGSSVVAEAEQLRAKLQPRLAELEKFPFLTLECARFLGDQALEAAMIMRIKRDFFPDPAQAEYWHEWQQLLSERTLQGKKSVVHRTGASATRVRLKAVVFVEVDGVLSRVAKIERKGIHPRTEIFRRVRAYIKDNKLVDPTQQVIHADDKLRIIFDGRSEIRLSELGKFIDKHTKRRILE